MEATRVVGKESPVEPAAMTTEAQWMWRRGCFFESRERSMSETTEEYLNRVRDEVRKLKSLLDDPQPGLSTWCIFYAERMKAISVFWHPNCKDLNVDAAPDLLDALRELVAIEDRDNVGDPDRIATDNWRKEVWSLARSAIQKATTKETPA